MSKVISTCLAAAMLATPVLAQEMPETAEPQCECCERMKQGTMDCCEKGADGKMHCKMMDQAQMDHGNMDHSAHGHSHMEHSGHAEPQAQ